MRCNMKSKWRNKSLWMAILAFGLLISKTIFKYEVPMGNEIINGILGILILSGIIKNH